jgi:LPXTG-motif cell wall-anchored protein
VAGVQNLPRAGMAPEPRQNGTLIAIGLLMTLAGSGIFFAARRQRA